ncbi:hypothetical protein [Halobacterium jilantaiense]|uniref:hypothetical protein n=1 Tax=Halobacterium jilantaiense TaxID=355548 RepID=UPI00115FDC06|nr:hypothetical protein [Halobacterium jilantaiense]
MASELTTALVAVGGGLVGAVLRPSISAFWNSRVTNNRQSSIDQRQFGQIYAEEEIKALTELAEATNMAKLTVDRLYPAVNDAPAEYQEQLLEQELVPVIEDFFKTRGRYLAFEGDDEFTESINEFANSVSNCNKWMHQSVSQNTSNPTNTPDFDPHEFNSEYKEVMEEIRSRIRPPIDNWKDNHNIESHS